MDRTAHVVSEHVVDQLVLLDARGRRRGSEIALGAEVVATAGEVVNHHLGAGEGSSILFLQLDALGIALQGIDGLADIMGPMVTLTDIAAEKVTQFMEGQGAAGDIGLRVGVRGGGCSGFQYALALDERRDDDHVFDASGVRVLVDPASLRYVEGSTVDFTESFQARASRHRTRNVVASCGCGSSFRVADEEPLLRHGRLSRFVVQRAQRYRHASVL